MENSTRDTSIARKMEREEWWGTSCPHDPKNSKGKMHEGLRPWGLRVPGFYL